MEKKLAADAVMRSTACKLSSIYALKVEDDFFFMIVQNESGQFNLFNIRKQIDTRFVIILNQIIYLFI